MNIKLFQIGFLVFLLSNTVQSETLRESFSDHFLMGTIWHGNKLGSDKNNKFLEQEKRVISSEFNAITAENAMKPRQTQPREGVFTFKESDEMVAFAEAHNLTIIGHTLVWKNSAPDWFFMDKQGGRVSRDELIERMKTHIKTVMGRYKGRIKYWDVVNEAIETKRIKGEKGFEAFYKPSPWLDIIGPEYIEIAYRAAREADPTAKLLYNDYNLDQEAKLDFALEMIMDLKSCGVDIHGLGYQGHLFIDEPTLDSIERVFIKSKSVNIPVHVTELDVSVLPNGWKHRTASVEERFKLSEKFNPYPKGAPEEVLHNQAKRYADIFKIFVNYSDIIERVTFWGVWDGNSWRDYRPMLGRTDYPLLIGREFEKKPAYNSVIQTAKSQ